MLEHPAIAALLPHDGAMVLIDQVVDYTEQTIHCRSRIAALEHHPLAVDGTLAAVALVEYAAQAMAVHGGLLAPHNHAPRPGRLVALGQLHLAIDRIIEPLLLDICANRLSGDDRGQVYTFTITAAAQTLASGQATVMFVDGNDRN
jgi:predicted hotdog family 3-hydroxylacyl-ACP dehydratase